MTEPRQTIYINNLNEKVTINKLKNELTKTFAPCGKIVQITALKTLKLKGQAFITFDNLDSATKALELSGMEIFSKPMKITYAKFNSDVIESEDSVNERKKSKLQTTNKKRKLNDDGKTNNNKKKNKKKDNKSVVDADEWKKWKELPPNHILLIQNLQRNIEKLDAFFEKFPGFENIRLVKVRNLAFIEFENEEMATSCLEGSTDEQLKQFGDDNNDNNDVILSYAKK